MQFHDLKAQYEYLKQEIDANIEKVIDQTSFIGGQMVIDLENRLAEYVGVKHCISCANGTDALQLALMAWNVGKGDAVFVPDFTFFASGEVVSAVGATPIFVDVDQQTYNMDPPSLERMIDQVLSEGKVKPKAIVAVDLFGQPADHIRLKDIAEKYDLLILEDGAQGFGGRIGDRRACSFGDISTTSFFPVKPLGCYGDGGAVFTDNDEWAELIQSYKVHGKGTHKYDNVRIGMNSRLDSIQAAVLLAKFPVFAGEELEWGQSTAAGYTDQLNDVVKTPVVKEGFYSSWAQYTIQLEDSKSRDGLQTYLNEKGIPSAIYYPKPMHLQLAFAENSYHNSDYPVTNNLSETVLSLPFHPYLKEAEIIKITDAIKQYIRG